MTDAVYVPVHMPLTLEERMETVERKLALLSDGLTKGAPNRGAWLKTVGLSKDDRDFDEMIRLGQACREESKQDADRAHS